MWKFFLGALFGAGLWMYHEKGLFDLGWAQGEMNSVKDIYEFTCANPSARTAGKWTGHNENFWKARLQDISTSNNPESLEAQAINQILYACDYIGDESVNVANQMLAHAERQRRE